jgi:hypothetical protein
VRAFLSKTIHSRRNDTQCAYYMQPSKTTVPIAVYAPMIARQCQLTKYTYPTLSPAGQNPAHKSRVDQSPTKTPPPHLTRQHTRDTSSIRHNLTSPRAHNLATSQQHQPPRSGVVNTVQPHSQSQSHAPGSRHTLTEYETLCSSPQAPACTND